MLVPETPVHKDDLLLIGECQVWFTGQVAPMEPEATAQLTRDSTDAYFRFGMPSADGAHIGTALILRDRIRHI
jgi:hypothetical protein